MARHDAIEVTVGPQGRLVVPARLRQRLGIHVGEVLLASAQDDRLVLERRGAVLARLRERYAGVPREVDMATELIDQRRGEAARERKR